jgi:UDP-N-acetylglucosamine--N-acetylmuramyl-(pentapeptide) pyrophosphoryl-undecaprenol N-acetylglucosamine transferase
MEAASLVLGRAGASTCAELQAAGRPSVLVPLPTSANDHQRQNARAMVAEGRALLLEQGEGFPARLQAVLETLMGDPRQRFHMAKAPERNHAVDLCLDDLIPYLG